MSKIRKPEGKRPGIGKSLRSIRDQKLVREDNSWIQQWEAQQEAKQDAKYDLVEENWK